MEKDTPLSKWNVVSSKKMRDSDQHSVLSPTDRFVDGPFSWRKRRTLAEYTECFEKLYDEFQPGVDKMFEQVMQAERTQRIDPELGVPLPPKEYRNKYTFEGLINQYPILETLVKSSKPADIFNLCKSSKTIRNCISTQNVVIETPRQNNKIRPSCLFYHNEKFWVSIPQDYENKEGGLYGHFLLDVLIETPFEIENLFLYIAEKGEEKSMALPMKEALKTELYMKLRKLAKNIVLHFDHSYDPKEMNEVIKLTNAYWVVFGKDSLPKACEKDLPALLNVAKVTMESLNNENEAYFSMNFLAQIRTVENCIIGLEELRKLVRAFCTENCKMVNHLYRLKTQTRGTDIMAALHEFMTARKGGTVKEDNGLGPGMQEIPWDAYWENNGADNDEEEHQKFEYNRFVVRRGDAVLHINFGVDLATTDFTGDLHGCGIVLDVEQKPT